MTQKGNPVPVCPLTEADSLVYLLNPSFDILPSSFSPTKTSLVIFSPPPPRPPCITFSNRLATNENPPSADGRQSSNYLSKLEHIDPVLRYTPRSSNLTEWSLAHGCVQRIYLHTLITSENVAKFI